MYEKVKLPLTILVLLLILGCGKSKIKSVEPGFYPDGITMFEKIWKEQNQLRNIPRKTVNKIQELTSNIDVNRIRSMINQGDFNEINQLVSEGYIDSAISRLKLMKTRYKDNPFFQMQCNFYLSELYKKKGDPGWRDNMDELLKYYEDIQNDENIQRVIKERNEDDKFLQRLLLKTQEAELK